MQTLGKSINNYTIRKAIINCTIANKLCVRSIANHPSLNAKDIQRDVKPYRKIPGPPLLAPLLMTYFQNNSQDGEDNDITQIYKRYGPIVKLKGLFGSYDRVILFDAEASAQILRSENSIPVRIIFQSLDYYRKVYSKRKNYLDGDQIYGLATDQKEVWKKFRSLISPILLQPKTIKLYKNSLNEVAEDMVKRLRIVRGNDNMLNQRFSDEMNLWALESVGVIALGGRIGCLDFNLPKDSKAKQLIENVHEIFKITEAIDSFIPSIWRYISTPSFRRAMMLYENQYQLSRYYIEKAKEELKTNGPISTEEKSVLEKLLDINENVAVIIVNDMLFGGVDTTSNTVVSTLYLLAKNQDKQNKLREEILSQKDDRPYLKACVKEAMRLLPVVGGNMRMTTKDYDVLGYRIPKNICVGFAHQFLSSMEEHFPRPKEYIPERWITDKSDPLYHGNAHPFAFNPFGFGVRSCIGRRMAELEVQLFIAKFIENFQVDWSGAPMRFRRNTFNYAIPPFHFVLKDIK